MFTLKIRLGNEAMQTREDVADALRKTADALDTYARSGGIMDDNGNTVGSWKISGERA